MRLTGGALPPRLDLPPPLEQEGGGEGEGEGRRHRRQGEEGVVDPVGGEKQRGGPGAAEAAAEGWQRAPLEEGGRGTEDEGRRSSGGGATSGRARRGRAAVGKKEAAELARTTTSAPWPSR